MTLEHFKLPRDDWYDITNWDYIDKEVYDPSKFTVIGNPTITDDGVVSGFSADNALSTTQNISYNNSFKIIFPDFILSPYTHDEQNFITVNSSNFLLKTWQSRDLTISLYDGTSNIVSSNVITNLTVDTLYSTKLIFENDTYKFYVKGGIYSDWTETWSHASSSKAIIGGFIGIGTRRDYPDAYFEGSVDLKKVSITVDGKEVFKGTKTVQEKVPPKGEIVGRLYKEALIENFNALESKFNELSSLTAYETQIPDFATYDYDDVTLDSESNKVVNLKSFLTIMDLIGVPLDVSFSGKICKKISYYDNNMRLHTITNQTIEGLGVDNKVYVVLDTANDTVYATADATDLSGKFLIGIYENGTIYNVNSKNLLDINILTHLCDMSIETRNFGTIPRDMIPTNLTINNRAVGAWGRESGGAWASDVVLSDVGRISK